MALLKIITAPDPVLKRIARDVDQIDDRIRRLKNDMFETMYHARGVGLAAPQINISERIITIDTARGEDDLPKPLFFANPVIVEKAEELSSYEEGCLSLPDFYLEMQRPAWIRLDYLDEHNQKQTMKAEGFLATVLQHEIDHLNGVLLLDYASSLKRNMALKRFTKLKKEDVL